MTSGHVFIAASLDGYIARADGGIDWLEPFGSSGEDTGYGRFIAGMDAIVMGRGTWETAKGFDPWPYALPVLVLSRQLAGRPVPAGLEGRVEFSDASPAAAMALLAARGHARAYVDGGQLVTSFLGAGLIAGLTVTHVPLLLGGGRPLFGALPAEIALEHEETRAFASGLVQSRYRVAQQG
ncbi:dihydrofolate reductase family protein [Poseidonocella sp. HB161398]|uniref:dihydrofolate reductase family protein n=1 Tax=Poseidonocella sp. HB161398 TaxID=2320855 RepID=UPI00110877C7|nr:dihydrofolate reductase family protein [Poseidonocella sp. HB161398]